jgi:F0F1-type ATP synthase assembly protein I
MTEQLPRTKARWYARTEAASIGIEIAISVVVGALGGYFLERHVTHWSPWTTLVGLAIGIGAAANAVIRTARRHKQLLRDGSDDDPPAH